MSVSGELWIAVWAVVGLLVGSFLNVAIHRFPIEGESVARPRRSRCPSCRHALTWRDNVPLVSWILLRGRCRSCGWRIPLRYPLVEGLTGGLFALSAGLLVLQADLEGGVWGGWEGIGLHLVRVTVLSGLIVATFVDFDCFEIPDEISIGGMILAPIASVLVPRLHEATWVARELSGGGQVTPAGALVGSLAGILVGGGVLLSIGWAGKRVFGREAMGLGDVKLLAAGGGLVGPGGALAALLIGTFLASLVGLANMLRFFLLSVGRARRRSGRARALRALRVARIAGRYLPFGPYLGIGIGIALLAWNHVLELLSELAFRPH